MAREMADATVVDEVLCYITCWFKSDPADAIIRDCAEAFSEEDIEKAKLRFFNDHGKSRYIQRKRNGLKPKATLDMEDLVREVIVVTSENRELPIYVARDLKKLPARRGGISTCSSSTRAVEARLDDISRKLETLESIGEKAIEIARESRTVRLSTSNGLGKREREKRNVRLSAHDVAGKTTVGLPSSTLADETSSVGMDIGRKSYSEAAATGESKTASTTEEGREGQHPGGTETGESTCSLSTRSPNLQEPEHADREDVKDGFIEVQSRRKRATKAPSKGRGIVGTRTGSTGIGGVKRVKREPRAMHLYIGRCDPEVTIDELRLFLTGEGIEVLGCQALKARHPSYASFHVQTNEKHAKNLLDPKMWGEGIEVRPFYFPTNETASAQGREKNLAPGETPFRGNVAVGTPSLAINETTNTTQEDGGTQQD